MEHNLNKPAQKLFKIHSYEYLMAKPLKYAFMN